MPAWLDGGLPLGQRLLVVFPQGGREKEALWGPFSKGIHLIHVVSPKDPMS